MPQDRPGIIRYARTYRALAVQLVALEIVRAWYDMRVDATEAAKWANLGFMPGEARRYIEEGVSPELVRECEQAASAVWDELPEAGVQALREALRDGPIVVRYEDED